MVLLFACVVSFVVPVFAQVPPPLRSISRTVDVQNINFTDTIDWFQGDDVEYNIWLVHGDPQQPVVLASNETPVWIATDSTRTNPPVIYTNGIVRNATNGQLQLYLPSPYSALDYTKIHQSAVVLYRPGAGTNILYDVADRTIVKVKWRPSYQGSVVGPAQWTNGVLDDHTLVNPAFWAIYADAIAASLTNPIDGSSANATSIHGRAIATNAPAAVDDAYLWDGNMWSARAVRVTSANITDGTILFADIGQNGATNNQVMKWNGSAWVAADDTGGAGGTTNVTAANLDANGGIGTNSTQAARGSDVAGKVSKSGDTSSGSQLVTTTHGGTVTINESTPFDTTNTYAVVSTVGGLKLMQINTTYMFRVERNTQSGGFDLPTITLVRTSGGNPLNTFKITFDQNGNLVVSGASVRASGQIDVTGDVITHSAFRAYDTNSTSVVVITPTGGLQVGVASFRATPAGDISQDATNSAQLGAVTAQSFTGNGAGLSNISGVISANATSIQGRAVSNAAPTHGQVMEYSTNCACWLPATDDTGSGGGGAFATTNAGNVLLTNNTITNLSGSAGLFITDPLVKLSPDTSNSTFMGYANYAWSGQGFVMNGTSNRIAAASQREDYAAILSGRGNAITDALDSVVCGGWGNSIKTTSSGGAIVGGNNNTIRGPYSFIGGGGGWAGGIEGNRIESGYSVIGGGNYNAIEASANNSVVAGGYSDTIGDSAIRSFIGGGAANSIGNSASYSFLGGGLSQVISASATHSTLCGGSGNNVGADGGTYSFVGGGNGNQARLSYDAVVGGFQNYCSCDYGFIGGGYQNRIQGTSHSCVLAGGYINTIMTGCDQATISGGNQNIITNNADHSTIPGGSLNQIVGGQESFAAGRRARVLHNGSFVWSSDVNGTGFFDTTSSNQFLIDAAVVCIGTNVPMTVGGTNILVTIGGNLAVAGDGFFDTNSIYLGTVRLGAHELNQLYTARKLTNIFAALSFLLLVNFGRDRWRERKNKKRDEEQLQRIVELERKLGA